MPINIGIEIYMLNNINFSNTSNNRDFNQMRYRFTLPPSSFFFNYALLTYVLLLYVNFCHNTANGINAKAFLQLNDSIVASDQLEITFGGKLILKKLLQALKN